MSWCTIWKCQTRLPVSRSRRRGFRRRGCCRAMAAVVVAGRDLDRQVDEAELLVDRSSASRRRCCRCTTTSRSRPGLVAELAGLRDGVEDPEPLAGAHVVRADVALGVVVARARVPARMRRADDDDVSRDDRRAVPGDLAGLMRDRDPGPRFFRSTTPFRRSRRAAPGLRVEADQLIADRDVEDALVALAVGPVADAASRKPARRRLGAAPSSSRCIQSSSPVAALMATALRCSPRSRRARR